MISFIMMSNHAKLTKHDRDSTIPRNYAHQRALSAEAGGAHAVARVVWSLDPAPPLPILACLCVQRRLDPLCAVGSPANGRAALMTSEEEFKEACDQLHPIIPDEHEFSLDTDEFSSYTDEFSSDAYKSSSDADKSSSDAGESARTNQVCTEVRQIRLVQNFCPPSYSDSHRQPNSVESPCSLDCS